MAITIGLLLAAIEAVEEEVVRASYEAHIRHERVVYATASDDGD
jgi:hypothetical protein